MLYWIGSLPCPISSWLDYIFHIGSQITDMDVFKGLCVRINEIQESLYRRMLIVDTINVGGGLGIDYEHPNRKPIPDFASYFATFKKTFEIASETGITF